MTSASFHPALFVRQDALCMTGKHSLTPCATCCSCILLCRYAVQKGAYDEYFSKLTGQYNNLWSAPEGENDTASLRVATVAATAVILTPLVLVGAKIGMQWMR